MINLHMTVSNKLSDGKSILVDVTGSKSLKIIFLSKKTYFFLLYNIKVIVVCESLSVWGKEVIFQNIVKVFLKGRHW